MIYLKFLLALALAQHNRKGKLVLLDSTTSEENVQTHRHRKSRDKHLIHALDVHV